MDRGDETPADVAQVRSLYPSWAVGVTSVTVATGPGSRTLWARRGGVLLTADSAGGLVALIERQPSPDGPPGS